MCVHSFLRSVTLGLWIWIIMHIKPINYMHAHIITMLYSWMPKSYIIIHVNEPVLAPHTYIRIHYRILLCILSVPVELITILLGFNHSTFSPDPLQWKVMFSHSGRTHVNTDSSMCTAELVFKTNSKKH